MLNELTIEGLRGVGRVELTFDSRQAVRTLFGSNGVGKTKCLEALYLFLLFSNKAFISDRKSAVRSDSFIMGSASSANGLTIKAPPQEWAHVEQFWGGGLPSEVHDLPIVFVGAQKRGALAKASSAPILMGTFVERREQYFSSVHQALQSGALAEAGMSENVQPWFVSRAQSVNPYQKAADNRRVEIDTVLEILNALDDRIDSSFLQIDGAGSVSLKVTSQVLELRQLSSGFTSLVKLVQAIVSGYSNFTNELNLRHVRGVVLIDEIESHLHAQWQSRIVPTLKTLLPNTTFYIATHSPLVLAQLEEGEAYVLQRDGDGVVRSHMVSSPNKRAFADVLADAFGVDLNKLKRESLEKDDQTQAKRALLALLDGAKDSKP